MSSSFLVSLSKLSVVAVLALFATRQANDQIPHGTVTRHRWTNSRIFPGTERDYWVYVPAQYDSARPACVMVFQDGSNYLDPKRPWQVPALFDRLIHAKEMPVTIGVFVMPGTTPAVVPRAKPRINRSFEYDSLDDRYVRFLLDELLPEVGKSYNLAQDGNSRAIGGTSSAAVAAFTAAWQRPDAFSRVFSAIGSYVDLRGGNQYIALVRKTEPIPLRIFLQDGKNDQNIYAGSWWIANQDMLAALQFAGYDVLHEWGDGGHDWRHGAAVLPDALRWLWRDYPAAVTAKGESLQPVMKVLVPGEFWQLVTRGPAPTGGLASNDKGDVFFADNNGSVFKVGDDNELHPFVQQKRPLKGLSIGQDGQLFAADPNARQVVAYDTNGKRTILARNVAASHITVSSSGRIYASEPSAHRIVLIDESRRVRTAVGNLPSVGPLQLTKDQGWLFMTLPNERLVHSFQVQADGSLANGQPYCYLDAPGNVLSSGGEGMSIDASGRLYVSTTYGIQLCDVEGRVDGIIRHPIQTRITQIAFGGPRFNTLYGASPEGLFRRIIKTTSHANVPTETKPSGGTR